MTEWEKTVNEAAQRAEREVRGLIDYLNDEVVPDVRLHGSAALRVAADRLQELARVMEDTDKPGGIPRP